MIPIGTNEILSMTRPLQAPPNPHDLFDEELEVFSPAAVIGIRDVNIKPVVDNRSRGSSHALLLQLNKNLSVYPIRPFIVQTGLYETEADDV